MRVCEICYRESQGFGFIPPPFRASNPMYQRQRKHFCSRNCQEIFYQYFKSNNMIDLTKAEKDSIESALKPVGEYVAEIGMNRPVADYSREEVLCLIEVAVTAYQDSMRQKENSLERHSNLMEDLPC